MARLPTSTSPVSIVLFSRRNHLPAQRLQQVFQNAFPWRAPKGDTAEHARRCPRVPFFCFNSLKGGERCCVPNCITGGKMMGEIALISILEDQIIPTLSPAVRDEGARDIIAGENAPVPR